MIVIRSLQVTLLLFVASSLLAAQQTIPLAGIAHVAIRVKDLAASRAFYLSLGYEEPFDLRKDDIPYESFIKINDHQFIELYPVTAKDPKPQFLHLCFEGADLNALQEDYSSNGLKPTEVRKAGAGNLLFTMPGPLQPLGPNGSAIPQNIEYTQYMPGSRHSNDFGQHLGPDRIADRLLGVSLVFVDPDDAREFYFNNLNFKPLPNQNQLLHLPGSSGEYVSIQPAATQGTRARIVLDTQALGRAERELRKNHIAFEKIGTTPEGRTDAILFTDPDGNDILIEQR